MNKNMGARKEETNINGHHDHHTIDQVYRHRPLQLSGDALFQIFLRLPARDLLRLRSTCKSWHNLITSRPLAECHLRHWNGRGGLAFILRSRYHYDFELFQLSLDGENYVIDKLCHEYPPEMILNGHNIIDSCDRLLLMETRFMKPGKEVFQEALVMCNVVTRSYILLPLPPNPSIPPRDQWSSHRTAHIVYDVSAPPTPGLLLENWSDIVHVFKDDGNVVLKSQYGDAFSMYDMISGKCTCISVGDYKEWATIIPWRHSLIYVNSLVSLRNEY
ncbi:hypothetical protein SAY87_006808 [Trapa incisa]|uniref:F-box domain-containing protein n=1 Tax=Trapa incisa TaxID=236973 RepID=A0AAN7JZC6_9MYRT|nr:hypothetical protein SAY87_006808 [Trapa incisa]